MWFTRVRRAAQLLAASALVGSALVGGAHAAHANTCVTVGATVCDPGSVSVFVPLLNYQCTYDSGNGSINETLPTIQTTPPFVVVHTPTTFIGTLPGVSCSPI